MMFSRALALEAKRDGVRVNCLTPSIVRGTPLYDELMADPFASKLFAKAPLLAPRQPHARILIIDRTPPNAI